MITLIFIWIYPVDTTDAKTYDDMESPSIFAHKKPNNKFIKPWLKAGQF